MTAVKTAPGGLLAEILSGQTPTHSESGRKRERRRQIRGAQHRSRPLQGRWMLVLPMPMRLQADLLQRLVGPCRNAARWSGGSVCAKAVVKHRSANCSPRPANGKWLSTLGSRRGACLPAESLSCAQLASCSRRERRVAACPVDSTKKTLPMTLTSASACCCWHPLKCCGIRQWREEAVSDPALALETNGALGRRGGCSALDYCQAFLPPAYRCAKALGSVSFFFHPVRLAVIGAFDLFTPC